MDSRKERAEKAAQIAKQYELDYGCCPQCVLAAVKETGGRVSDETIKASHGLSGGGGLTGVGLCGALSGGLLALGTKRGRDADKFARGKFIGNFKAGEKLVEQFRTEFGGVTCQELQHHFTGRTYDMWNPAEYQAFDEARGSRCAEATEFVTRLVVAQL
jgi:C_GCAxxG_C_C family probable redox protein